MGMLLTPYTKAQSLALWPSAQRLLEQMQLRPRPQQEQEALELVLQLAQAEVERRKATSEDGWTA
jgi:hypothetical protein